VTNVGSKMGKEFLEEIDNFLAHHYQTLKCSDISDIYFQFSSELKKLKGNSNGFTGLSEYLIFRFFCHLLGGSFRPVEVTPAGLNEFVSDKGFRIGQSTPIMAGGKRYYPDIVVYRDDKLKAIAQVKVYITGGLKEIKGEIGKLKALKDTCTALRALIIIFDKLPNKGKSVSELRNERDQSSGWLDFLALKGNTEVLSSKLEAFLGISKCPVCGKDPCERKFFLNKALDLYVNACEEGVVMCPQCGSEGYIRETVPCPRCHKDGYPPPGAVCPVCKNRLYLSLGLKLCPLCERRGEVSPAVAAEYQARLIR